MSDLYKEALADAAKIREIAEQDARNAILEKISPYIKQMIVKEASNAFLLEQEEMMPDEQQPPVAATPEVSSPVAEPALESDSGTELPIAPVGNSDVVNVPMPTADGKITLDFDDLFVKDSSEIISPSGVEDASSMEVAVAAPPTDLVSSDEVQSPVDASVNTDLNNPDTMSAAAASQTAGPVPAPEVAGAAGEEETEEPAPMPSAPIAEAKSIKVFEKSLAEMALKIDRMYSVKVTDLTRDAYKSKLFSLLEQLDSLAANKAITPKQAQLNENRLEFLFLHLKEAKLNNSYNKQKDKETNMTTLKEFAAKLFESADEEHLAQDSVSTGDTGIAVHKAATAHAQSADGVQADLFAKAKSDTVEVHAGAGTVDADELEGLEGKEEAWEKALMEEVMAALKDEKDSSKADKVVAEASFEINEAALRKAIAKIRKESSSKKRALKEDMDMGSDSAEGVDENLMLSVELPDEVEEQLDSDDLDVDVMLSGDEDMLSGDEDMLSGADAEEGEEEVELSLDGSEEGDEEVGSEEEMLLTDEEEGEEEEVAPMMESKKVRRALLESRTREIKARRLAEAKRAETATLKKEMAETNLFLSKLVYLNKFLVREDLSRKVKQQIVEHLDRATTIAEAKDIYGKIVKKLDEAAAAHTAPVVGSASKPTTAGSARLNEGANKAASSEGSVDPVIGTFEKWQILANIKKNG